MFEIGDEVRNNLNGQFGIVKAIDDSMGIPTYIVEIDGEDWELSEDELS